jgi:hypothetical protein
MVVGKIAEIQRQTVTVNVSSLTTSVIIDKHSTYSMQRHICYL